MGSLFLDDVGIGRRSDPAPRYRMRTARGIDVQRVIGPFRRRVGGASPALAPSAAQERVRQREASRGELKSRPATTRPTTRTGTTNLPRIPLARDEELGPWLPAEVLTPSELRVALAEAEARTLGRAGAPTPRTSLAAPGAPGAVRPRLSDNVIVEWRMT
jgi:hypothetical protein